MTKIPCELATIKNGLEVLNIHKKDAQVVAIQAWIQFGCADEEKLQDGGVAHFFEHLLFKGTKKRAVGQIALEIEALGGDLNAYTSHDQTVMHVTLNKKYLEKGIEILSDALGNTVLDPEEIKKEQDVVCEEIKRKKDRPNYHANQLLRKNLFRDHPYSKSILGSAENVKGFTQERIQYYYDKYYCAKNMFLALSGDVPTATFQSLAEKHFSILPSGNKNIRPEFTKPLFKKKEEHYMNFGHKNNYFYMAWPSISDSHPELAAYDALALIIGQGESARLQSSLVNTQQLVRHAASWNWAAKSHGSLEIASVFQDYSPLKHQKISDAISKELDRPITQKELTKAKKNMLSTNIFSKENVDALAEKYAHFHSTTGSFENEEKYTEEIRNLAVRDLEKIRKEVLNPEKAIHAGSFVTKNKIKKLKSAPKKAKTKKLPQEKNPIIEKNIRGLKVILIPDNTLPLISLRWIGLGGTRLEKEKDSGVGSLWARSVHEGGIDPQGKKWLAKDINELIDNTSSSMNVVHGKNSWGFYIDGLSEDFSTLYNLIATVKDAPLFNEEDLKRERKHFISDIKSSENNPSHNCYRLFQEKIFEGHPYARNTHGKISRINKITSTEIKRYHKKLLSQPQVLCLAGDFQAEEMISFLKEKLQKRSFPKNSSLYKRQALKKLTQNESLFKKIKKEQSHILIGFQTTHMNNKDKWALMALSAILSGQGGRLFLKLRDQESLCYSVYPTHIEGFDAGFFAISIATSPEKVEQAKSAIHREFKRLYTEKIPAQELKKAIQFFTGRQLIQEQSLSGKATSLALCKLYKQNFKEHFETAQYLESLKSADLQKVAKKYFSNKNYVEVVVGS